MPSYERQGTAKDSANLVPPIKPDPALNRRFLDQIQPQRRSVLENPSASAKYLFNGRGFWEELLDPWYRYPELMA
jgi:hypothetical protein